MIEAMRFALDRLPTDPVLLQKMLLEMADAMEQERAGRRAAEATVKAQTLRIEKLEHRVARLQRVQFGRSSEKMDIAQLRLMFEEVEATEPVNDEVPAAPVAKSARKPGSRAPLPAHFPRQTVDHQPSPCSGGCNGPSVQIDETVTEVLDYVPARFRVIRHVRPRLVCRSCEQIRQAPAVDLPLPKVVGGERCGGEHRDASSSSGRDCLDRHREKLGRTGTNLSLWFEY